MKNENTIGWVHVSDIHIGHENYVEDIMRGQLPDFLRQLSKDHNFDLLFITGDLIWAGKYSEEKSGIKDIEPIRRIIRELQSAIGVDNAHTCISIGNHDVIRHAEKNSAVQELVKTYRSNSGDVPKTDDIFMAELRFASLYQKILGRDYPCGHFIEKISISSGNRAREMEVLNLDTVITAEGMQSDNKSRVLQDGNLIVGARLLKDALKVHQKGCPIIAIGHHPLNALMKDERNMVVREMQSAGIRIYLCGHTHIANIYPFSKNKAPIIQICCGTNMEQLENKNPADMTFEIGTYDLDTKAVSVETYQYFHGNNKEWGWKKISEAPFEQTQFEKDLGLTTFYSPEDTAPHYSIIEKYIKSISGKVIGEHDFYVKIVPEVNLKRPTAVGTRAALRDIYEADTGYGKTMFLRKKAFESMKVSENHEIRKKIITEPVKCPFFIDFELKKVHSKGNSLLSLLAKSIHLSQSCSSRFRLFDEWVNYLADMGRLLLLVDGIDKLPEEERETFCMELHQFLQDHPKVDVCITAKCFVFDSSNMQKKFEIFSFYRIDAFNDDQIREYCRQWYAKEFENIDEDSATQNKAANIAEQIIGDPALKELACVPLLLNTLLQVNKAMDTLPKNRIRLYDSFVYALLKDEPYPESDIQLLAAIAYKMHEEHTYLFADNEMKRVIQKINANCDWLQLSNPDRTRPEPCKFLARMDENSKLLKKQPGSRGYSFYNNEIQDYFAAMALARGFYADLLPAFKKHDSDPGENQLPLLTEIGKYLDNVENSNMLELTILQLNTYETFLVIEKITDHIIHGDESPDTTIVTSSYLRNLLLWVILDGAYITKVQRRKVFEAVQRQNIFNLQADLLEEVWNSQYSEEFGDTCTSYINSMFRLLKNESNPIQYLHDTIYISENEVINNSEVEEKLYVLDGVIWSKGRKYIDLYKQVRQIDELVGLLESILKCDTADALCKRRACGVLQRLLENAAIDSIHTDLISIIFCVFETDPEVEYRKKFWQDDKYAGIRIFHAIPLNEDSILFMKSLKSDDARKEHYRQLYESAQNPQDKLSAFEATVFCGCWDLDQIEQIKKEQDFFKSKMIDLDDFNLRMQELAENHFFE